MMLTCRSYTATRGAGDASREFLLSRTMSSRRSWSGSASDILANSWYANQVNKRALIGIDGLSLREAHALELFKNEGLAPDAAKRVQKFFAERKDAGG